MTMKRHNQTSFKMKCTTNDDCNQASTTKLEEFQQKHNLRIMRDIREQQFNNRIKKLETETMYRIREQISALMDSVRGELENFDNIDNNNKLFNNKALPEGKKYKQESEKKFIAQASPLSELMEVRHIRSLYHMFIAALIIALVSGATGDTLNGGWKAVRIGVRHVPAAFAHLDRAMGLWILLFLTTCSIHPLLGMWNNFRCNIKTKRFRWHFDHICLFHLVTLLIIVNAVIISKMGSDMAPASAAFLLLEQTRFLMKIHAFLRSNIPRSPNLPSLSQYMYYLFAPTLIYQDSYPRTSHIRWRFIGGCFVEFLGAILMLSCIMELHVLPEFSSFGLEKQTAGSLAASISRTVLPASLFTLCGFYLFLHAWMNIWAEALRFADRRFYGAWWNATSYGEFYRTWNCVVHDYLHTYIYRDVLAVTGNKFIGRIAVFAVSAIFHEYILTLMLGFFYPVMFAQFFGVGAILGCVRGAAGSGRCANIFLWVSLACGVGLQISLYSMEAFARINCPLYDNTFINYFIPRSYSCNGLNL